MDRQVGLHVRIAENRASLPSEMPWGAPAIFIKDVMRGNSEAGMPIRLVTSDRKGDGSLEGVGMGGPPSPFWAFLLRPLGYGVTAFDSYCVASEGWCG